MKDWAEIHQPLVLPIAGREYRVPEMGYHDERTVLEAMADGDLDNDEFCRLTLGAALEEMRAANVPVAGIARAALTAWTDCQYGRLVAESVWATGPNPEALAADIAKAAAPAAVKAKRTRRAPAKAAKATAKVS